VAQLTDAAREIERTRDPSGRLPHPQADDEVAELARTLKRAGAARVENWVVARTLPPGAD